MRLTQLGFAGISFLLSVEAAVAFAPWEPAITIVGDAVEIRQVAAAKTVRESIEILQSDNCSATVQGRSLRLSPACEFVQAAYVASLRRGKDDTLLRVSFPFAVSARAAGHTLLLESPEVID